MRGGRGIINATPKPFISTWKTDNLSTGSTNNNQVRLPLVLNGKYNFIVDWGDGSTNTITTYNQAETTHTYASIGTYTITITGYIRGWYFADTGDRLKLISITQWGCLNFVNGIGTFSAAAGSTGSFKNCHNLTLDNVTDTPNFKGVTNLSYMFGVTNFTTINNINKWDVSKIENTAFMFYFNGRFNQNIGNWNMGNVNNPSFMFYCYLSGGLSTATGSFNNGNDPSIGNWNTMNFTNSISLFFNQNNFNQNIGGWDMSNNLNMGSMFRCQNVPGNFTNGDNDSIKNWDTSKVTKMNSVFWGQNKFNHPISSWNTANVDDMSYMFYMPQPGSTFNQPLSSSTWDTSKVTTMYAMFSNAHSFNQNIGHWNTNNVTNMGYMLQARSFNNGGSPDINNWDVSKVTNMSRMFQVSGSQFNQPLNNWNISNVTDFINFMSDSGFANSYSVENYSNLLIGWASRPVKPNISINFSQNKYNAEASASRSILRSPPNNWTIADGGQV